MFYHEEVYLPWTNQRYCINFLGEIKEANESIEVKVIDGVRMVELDWYDGFKLYKYDIIPIVCYFKVKIPSSQFDRIELIFKDSNKDNLAIDNLAYRFIDGPVESEVFPGYFYVPYYTDYVVDRTGDVISLKNFRRRNRIEHKKWSISTPVSKKNIKGGYYCGRGKRDHDDVDGVSRHRFLALTFIPYYVDPLSLTVNHKDGIPGNDRINNLEWMTYAENTKHAYDNNLYPNKQIKIIYLDESKGIEKRYLSIVKCAEENNFTNGFVSSRLNKPHIRYLDGHRFKFDDGLDWPEVKISRIPTIIRSVMARNVFTGTIQIFENSVKAEKYTGVNSGTIKYHCERESYVPIEGFNFRYANIDTDWPEHSEMHLKVFQRFPKGLTPYGVLLLNDKNEIVNFYECSEDFQIENNLTENQFYLLLKKKAKWNNLHLRKFNPRVPL